VSFHSLEFVVFLAAILGVYWSLPKSQRNLFLVPASVFFYGFHHAWFLLPFVVTTIVDYLVAMGIERNRAHGRRLVAISVTSNLALLCAFKYFNFFTENVAALFHWLHVPVSMPVLDVVLPAGISFYTFQSIGYVIDVYRGEVRACRNFRDYALFVAFFPQLVAGPIQRAGDLIGQIQRDRGPLLPSVAAGAFSLLMWGFFKKLVIADNVAITANKVFALQAPSFPVLWAGVLAFCIQIYADFSAYTDIARAVARLLGFELRENFNHPYIAQSPSDFWRRWHISLSSWIRDYLFIPLGGSRGSGAKTVRNLIIVFFLTGLWHGAAWNFILWGLYYAVLLILYRFAAAVVPARITGLSVAAVFRVGLMFIFTNVGWLIFREHSVAQLARDLTMSPFAADSREWTVGIYLAAMTALYAIPLALHLVWDLKLRAVLRRREWPPAAQIAGRTFVATLLFTLIVLLSSGEVRDFIYFQF
jgi:D-alanyl-lipoteichoic acid acyltransferase DltB (MBOAT superfamily)